MNPPPANFRFGLRAHDFGRSSAALLASRIAAQGASCVQLALGKAIEGLELGPGVINADMASAIRRDFERHQLQIAVLGCYINPIHPEIAVRNGLLDLFREHLRHARDFGCNIVALETGSVNADYSPHPDNHGETAFHTLVVSIAELVREAERCGVVVGVEAVTSHVISTPEKMSRLLDEIPSPNLQVVFDPVNLLTIENHGEQDAMMEDAFRRFGNRIAVIHAKDFVVNDGELLFVAPGSGSLNRPLLFSLAQTHLRDALIVLEEVDASNAGEIIKSMKKETLMMTFA